MMCKENLNCILTERCTNEEEIREDERRKTITEIEEIFLSFKYGRSDVFQFVSIDSVLEKLEQMKELKE